MRASRMRKGSQAWGSVTALALVAWLGCASTWGSPWQPAPDGWIVHRERGDRLRAPISVASVEWHRVDVKGAELAYRSSGGATLSLLGQCGRGLALPSVRARQLLIGTPDYEVLDRHSVLLGGASGFQQSVRVMEGSVEVRLETVTLVSGLCTFDWILAVPGGASDFGPIRASFESWWRSFRQQRGARHTPAVSGSPPPLEQAELEPVEPPQ